MSPCVVDEKKYLIDYDYHMKFVHVSECIVFDGFKILVLAITITTTTNTAICYQHNYNVTYISYIYI